MPKQKSNSTSPLCGWVETRISFAFLVVLVLFHHARFLDFKDVHVVAGYQGRNPISANLRLDHLLSEVPVGHMAPRTWKRQEQGALLTYLKLGARL